MIAYDIVGDVHGHAAKLEALLVKLGYTATGRTYRAPAGRQLIMLGDLIDRGPEQLRVLEIVQSMAESGEARCLMGNHEFNAIAFTTPDPRNPGDFLRPSQGASLRCQRNRSQHEQFLAQVGANSPGHRPLVAWFKTLPAALGLGGIRVVHGAWDSASVATLAEAGWGRPEGLSTDAIVESFRRSGKGTESRLMRARKLLTCGLELKLPGNTTLKCSDGFPRKDIRLASWRAHATELHEIALVSPHEREQLVGMPWPANLVLPAVAYRWDGEPDLSDQKMVWAY